MRDDGEEAEVLRGQHLLVVQHFVCYVYHERPPRRTTERRRRPNTEQNLQNIAESPVPFFPLLFVNIPPAFALFSLTFVCFRSFDESR